MSSFKKIAWSGSAVLLALVMALGLMGPTPASAVVTIVTAPTATVALTTNATNGSQAYTALGARFDCVATTDCPNSGVLQLNAPTGWQFAVSGVTAGVVPTGEATLANVRGGTAATVTYPSGDGSSVTVTLAATGAATAAGDDHLILGLAIRPNSNASVTGNITAGASTTAAIVPVGTTLGTITAGTAIAAPYTMTLNLVSTSSNCPAGPFVTPAQVAADGSQSLVLCAKLTDTNGAVVSNTPVLFTVSLGVVSTGTSKSVTAFTTTSGSATTNYRGGGGNVATDTAIASVASPTSAVGTLSISMIAATGNTASKIALNSPQELAVAATVTNTQPNYQSPKIQTNLSVKVSDAAGLGVNAQAILISTDKGAVVAGHNAACTTNKALTGTTATAAPQPGGTLEAGIIQLTFCANQLDKPGKATITAQNISTTMANATASVAMSGRPGKLEPTATGAAIAVKVSDVDGNAVADGTPVRFTISSQAGAVSTACTTTTNGSASAVAALIGGSGLVIISSDWNETGAAATCAAAGAQQIASSITVTGGTASTTPGTPAAGGTGTLTSGSVPATGFGLIVFGGGTIAQLVTASGVGTSGALYATVGGNFVPYVPGTTIAAVNADFMAAFPGGNIPANTAFVGRK